MCTECSEGFGSVRFAGLQRGHDAAHRIEAWRGTSCGPGGVRGRVGRFQAQLQAPLHWAPRAARPVWWTLHRSSSGGFRATRFACSGCCTTSTCLFMVRRLPRLSRTGAGRTVLLPMSLTQLNQESPSCRELRLKEGQRARRGALGCALLLDSSPLPCAAGFERCAPREGRDCGRLVFDVRSVSRGTRSRYTPELLVRTRGSCGTSMVGCFDAGANRNASGRPLPHSAGAVASRPSQAKGEPDGVVTTTMVLDLHNACGRLVGDPAAAPLRDRYRSVPRGTSDAFTVGRHRGRFVVWGRGTVPLWISVVVRGPRPQWSSVRLQRLPRFCFRSPVRPIAPSVPQCPRSVVFSFFQAQPEPRATCHPRPVSSRTAADQSSTQGTAPRASQNSRQHRRRHGRSQMRVRTSPQLSTGVATTRRGPDVHRVEERSPSPTAGRRSDSDQTSSAIVMCGRRLEHAVVR